MVKIFGEVSKGETTEINRNREIKGTTEINRNKEIKDTFRNNRNKNNNSKIMTNLSIIFRKTNDLLFQNKNK